MSNSKKIRQDYITDKKEINPNSEYHLINNGDESAVWDNFQKGNEEALIYIYRKYADVLYNYGCNITPNHDFVWDYIQNLFCELIKSRGKLGKVVSIKAYLFKSIKRKIIRGLKKEVHMEPIDAGNQQFELKVATGITPFSQNIDNEQIKLIEKYINQLPAYQREVLLLHFYEGLSYQEIANIFEVKVKSVRAQTYRALETLSKQVESKGHVLFVLMLLMERV